MKSVAGINPRVSKVYRRLKQKVSHNYNLEAQEGFRSYSMNPMKKLRITPTSFSDARNSMENFLPGHGLSGHTKTP